MLVVISFPKFADLSLSPYLYVVREQFFHICGSLYFAQLYIASHWLCKKCAKMNNNKKFEIKKHLFLYSYRLPQCNRQNGYLHMPPGLPFYRECMPTYIAVVKWNIQMLKNGGRRQLEVGVDWLLGTNL